MKYTVKQLVLCYLAMTQPYSLFPQSQPPIQEVCFKQNNLLVPAILALKDEDLYLEYDDCNHRRIISLLEDVVQPMQVVLSGQIIPSTTDSLNIPHYKSMLDQFKSALEDGCSNHALSKKLDEAHKVFAQYTKIQTYGYPPREKKKPDDNQRSFREIHSYECKVVQEPEENDSLSHSPDLEGNDRNVPYREGILFKENEDENIILPDCQEYKPQDLSDPSTDKSWSKRGILVSIGVMSVAGLLLVPSVKRNRIEMERA